MSHPGLPRRRSSAASGRSFRRRESMSTTITGMTDGSEWDDGELGDDDEDDEDLEEWEGGVGGAGTASVAGGGAKANGRKKKDEPMSPVAVVLYVVCFYLIWQILTRSDENEHLSHLSPSALMHPSSTFDLGPNGGGGSPYHMPYQFPHIPSPIPPSTSTSTTSSGGSSTWRLVLGVAVYPVYIAITLIAMPLPFLYNALYLVFGILGTVLYPFTSTIRLLTRTFLYTPLGIARSILAVFYPVYVFVGGVVGVGCVMGLGAGWAGKLGFDLITGRSRRSKRNGSSKSSKSRRSKSSRTKSSSSSRHRNEHRDREQAMYPEDSKANAPVPVPAPAPGPAPIIAHPQPLRGRSVERDLLDRWSRGELNYKATYGSPPSDDSSVPLHTPQDDMRATLPDVPYPYFPTKPERRKSRLSFGDLEDATASKAGSTRGVGTAREPVVVGVRRRGLRADLSVPR